MILCINLSISEWLNDFKGESPIFLIRSLTYPYSLTPSPTPQSHVVISLLPERSQKVCKVVNRTKGYELEMGVNGTKEMQLDIAETSVGAW